jgi:hypothetical protein
MVRVRVRVRVMIRVKVRVRLRGGARVGVRLRVRLRDKGYLPSANDAECSTGLGRPYLPYFCPLVLYSLETGISTFLH